MDRGTVKARRERLHLTQTAVAKAVGITRGALCRYESGDLQLSGETLDRIAEILGIDIVRRARIHLAKFERLAAQL